MQHTVSPRNGVDQTYNGLVLETVAQTIRRYSMFLPDQRVGVAVSAGADSVCLLHVLRELGQPLAVVHLNHKLRGAESESDEAFVRDLAAGLGVPFYGESTDLGGANVEQAGRHARNRLFARLVSEGAVDRIATAHTRSDQAETVLYRLLRGSGTAGLAGILPVTAEGVVRPLLECTRADVEQYLRERKVSWREDRTNRDISFARNRIRHRLLPMLDPAVPAILAATAEVARDEEDYWASEIDLLAGRHFRREQESVVIEATVLRSLHPAAARRLVRRAILLIKGDLRGIDILHVEQILGLAFQAEGHGRTQIPDLDVFRSFEWLRVGRRRTEARQERDYSFEVTPPALLGVPCSAAISLEFREEGQRYTEETPLLDWDRLSAPLELRNWHPGDEFQLPGRSRVKLKTLFQEFRVPLWERQGWPLLLSGGVVVWTRRFGVAEGFAASATTKRGLRVYEIG